MPELRENYKYFQQVPTRWNDNDVYGHVNNVQYYSYFDTVISTYLVKQGGLDFLAGPVIGVCAESRCRFLHEFTFPETVEAGLRVEHIGRSSVRYGIGLFRSEGSLARRVGLCTCLWIVLHGGQLGCRPHCAQALSSSLPRLNREGQSGGSTPDGFCNHKQSL
jgi:acyl-CoA thioesterase FadM